MLWQVVALVGLLALVKPRPRGAAPTGEVQMSRYFKAGGKCMYRPDGAPAYEIDCDDWARERESEAKEFLGG